MLERDCIMLKQAFDSGHIVNDKITDLQPRVDRLKNTVSADVVKKVDSLFQRVGPIRIERKPKLSRAGIEGQL